jgi:hypothetical protein
LTLGGAPRLISEIKGQLTRPGRPVVAHPAVRLGGHLFKGADGRNDLKARAGLGRMQYGKTGTSNHLQY